MTLETRRRAYADCRTRINGAFELATERGMSLADVVVLLIDETSVWSTARAFAAVADVDVEVAGRRRRVRCLVADRAAITAMWRRVYPSACAAIDASPHARNTMVLGFDEPAGATLFSERPWPANDTEPIAEEHDA